MSCSRRLLAVPLLSALCGLLLTGCLGYHVGPVMKGNYRSVAVPMFKNKTYKPQLEAQVTNGIIKRLQTDGTLRVDSMDNADIILTGEIIRYYRSMLRAEQTEADAPREFRIYIDARVEAHDRVTGRQIFGPTVVTGSADTFIGTDLEASEYQALPLIADDLARQVAGMLVESWQ
jgi:hypothetical protein